MAVILTFGKMNRRIASLRQPELHSKIYNREGRGRGRRRGGKGMLEGMTGRERSTDLSRIG